ncbi:MAG: hypothetical protein KAT17_03350 [Candidatus Aminicenantes bacterium]|nr:hypothetical protein [Candidatus Aminicenantes bacterium]
MKVLKRKEYEKPELRKLKVIDGYIQIRGNYYSLDQIRSDEKIQPQPIIRFKKSKSVNCHKNTSFP